MTPRILSHGQQYRAQVYLFVAKGKRITKGCSKVPNGKQGTEKGVLFGRKGTDHLTQGTEEGRQDKEQKKEKEDG